MWDSFPRGEFVRLGDAAGNMFVLPAAIQDDAADVPVVLLGSHLDTVTEGGWLDGALGVAVAAPVVERLGRAGCRVGLVVFRDEEGVRFRTGLFGSRVFAGLCTADDLAAVDAEGKTVRDVVPDAGGCVAYRRPVRPAAYLECHIEQGARLVERGRRVAVVTGIVGIRRFALVGTGAANHAGTTEMHRRVDALIPVAAAVAQLPELVSDLESAVITCGYIAARPGGANIVPGEATALVEFRAADTATLELIETRLRDLIARTPPSPSRSKRAALRLEPVSDIVPTATDTRLSGLLAEVCRQRDLPLEHLPSMAGHDAQHVARLCPAGMLFIPSIGGISHNPAEDSAPEDIQLAAELMLAWADRVTPVPYRDGSSAQVAR